MDKIIKQEIEQIIKDNNNKITKYKTMFNDGNNDGDVIIVCKDKEIKVHSEVLHKTSEYYRICEETFEFDIDKKLYFDEFDSYIVITCLQILYNSESNNIYFLRNWQCMCLFFVFIELLLLDTILHDKLEEMYDTYISYIKKGIYLDGKKCNDSFWIEILSYCNIDNKYLNRLGYTLIRTNFTQIRKSYSKHHNNLLENSNKKCNCGSGKINCIFNPDLVSQHIIDKMQSAILKYLAQ